LLQARLFPTEPCSTAGAVPVPFNDALVEQFTQDKNGNACGTFTATIGLWPAGTDDPFVAHAHFVIKASNYDPAPGSGDDSGTSYTGGKCNGSRFDSTGATADNTYAESFVASDDGKRVDVVVTALSEPAGDIGAFNLAGFQLEQK
jgi:hypothetical protein